jgi:hypothetical protein
MSDKFKAVEICKSGNYVHQILLNYISVNLQFLVASLFVLMHFTESKCSRFFTELPSCSQRKLMPGLKFYSRADEGLSMPGHDAV